MDNFIYFIRENITLFDIIFLIFILYFSIQCLIKGFVLSLISFLKWILALIITIKLFPIIEPYASDYVDMDMYVFVIGLGVFIYVISLFVLIMLGKSLGKLSYVGIGSADKIFGLFFGIFKGYIFAVCIFVIADKFDFIKRWDISTKNSIFFPSIEWGSKLLIDNFPNQKDFEKTKENIEKI
jgi:membrane protein required for colicin V production